jgi:hypothetical protein
MAERCSGDRGLAVSFGVSVSSVLSLNFVKKAWGLRAQCQGLVIIHKNKSHLCRDWRVKRFRGSAPRSVCFQCSLKLHESLGQLPVSFNGPSS